jgi:ferrous iron transport protein A
MKGSLPAPRPTLSGLTAGQVGRVRAVHAPATSPDWARWLAEIGFLPGEAVSVRSRGAWGGPLAVHVGQSLFALRRAEADCIEIELT